VAAVNARRHKGKQDASASGGQPLRLVPGALIRRYRYTWIALAMVVVAVGGAAILFAKVITLFWLEIVVALLFAVFWAVQTVELLPRDRPQPGDT
jgi:drug/metabolite transporter (DMT)-like permease